MGTAASSAGGERGERGTVLGDLPESCVAEILLRLDPPEICRMARLSRTFRGAASGDGLWQAKLPHNYARLLAIAAGGEEENGKHISPVSRGAEALAKREVYARLCRRNRLDGGAKEFWLDKRGGGLCMSISSKALSITGIDDRRYWNFVPTDESRFHTVAYLLQIWWLEVKGETEFCFPEGTYSVFFRLHLRRAARAVQVPPGRPRRLGRPPRRRIRCRGRRRAGEGEVLDGADRLHAHERRPLRGLRAHTAAVPHAAKLSSFVRVVSSSFTERFRSRM